ncbi:MAG TPA: hypothetical protein DCK95_08435 [Anaerolineaceae bacterium]|nr:hypothetical protein [Anaerolineaceae bacterium]
MKTLGFVGTAKNTGKTTTALHMLKLAALAGYRIALTSIGFDGENIDHITGLPKPRYYAEPGMVIATALCCLGYGTAQYKEITPTGIRTILGDVVIATVAEPGNVVLAGPNRRVDLKPMLNLLSDMGIELTFLDGALNRLAAMTLADGIILSTGAAFNENIEILTDHIAAMEALFLYSAFTGKIPENNACIQFFPDNKKNQMLPIGSVLNEGTLKQIGEWCEEDGLGDIFIPGVFSPHLFKQIAERYAFNFKGKSLIFSSPLNLLSSGSPEIWQSCFSNLHKKGTEIKYLIPIPLRFITVNPFFPKYLQKTATYSAEFVDKKLLLQQTRHKILRTPVVDILQLPHPDLLTICQL